MTGCRGKEETFDATKVSRVKWIKRFFRAKPLRPEDIANGSQGCFAGITFTFPGPCDVSVVKSAKRVRGVNLRFQGGLKVIGDFKPADEKRSPFHFELTQKNSDIEIPVGKDGGTLILGCQGSGPGQPCVVELLR
jgi:hypothetical protein